VIVLDDFVMLGKTVPEPSSDGRIFVCSAGVSAELRRLIRIYPLARKGSPPRWRRCRVPLERNPKDSREESFKIAGDRTADGHPLINRQFELLDEVKPRDRMALLKPFVVNSIAEANKKRRSLAVIHPEALDLHFQFNPTSPDSPQEALFEIEGEKEPQGAKRFAYIPRLNFKDECGPHDLMLRDWGCYEFMRKHGDTYAKQNMASALHLKRSSSLLVGNFNQHRTSWLVISVISGLREEPSLFDVLPDERPRVGEKLRRMVYERDEWACCICGSPDNLQVDHIVPHSRGGQTKLENLQTLCFDCNLSKGDSAGPGEE